MIGRKRRTKKYNNEEEAKDEHSLGLPFATSLNQEEKRIQRVSKMDLFSFEIEKDEKGLGILIRLFYDPADREEKKPSVFIMEIVEGGAAHKSGKFQLFDQIVNVNGTDLVGLNREEIDSTFKKMDHSVWIQIGRDSPENIRRLVKYLQKEEEWKRSFHNSAKKQERATRNSQKLTEQIEATKTPEKESMSYEISTLASLWRTREIEFKKKEIAIKSVLKKKVQRDTEFLKTAYATIAEAEAKLSVYEKKNEIKMDLQSKLEEKEHLPNVSGVTQANASSNSDVKNKRTSTTQSSSLVKAARKFARWFR
ncbi:neurabin-2-like isoform X1 [Monodelphis domestica]|uniref:neurabin-2-like isoform X1 n=2 Tax=Monodelphis domestica TaxID=13616 RepID=UPI0024E23229|nr:neurabin-2-like isoform X1 [Monodelphis domestica]XP_056649979.1 neurabin-2-like isoform X1 [Monodelphis domestica]